MADYKTVVIKIGSSTLTTKEGKLDIPNLTRLAADVAELIKKKIQVIIVTSGAIVAGSDVLNFKEKPRSIPEKQAAAAVGQSRLMRQYEKAFEKFNLPVAQILLTRDAIADRERYLNARHCILTLLAEGVVPVVNENDTVAVEEIKVGDNDTLSALVSSLVGADLLVLLTDVDGFFMESEEGVPYRARVIEEINEEVMKFAGHPSTQMGTGGMVTKLSAARITTSDGIPTVIAHGRKSKVLSRIIAGEEEGTYFRSKEKKPESRKRWLAHGLQVKGAVMVDPGAEKALLKGGSSLLPAGIKTVTGKFNVGDAVKILDASGREIGRGLTNYGSEEVEKVMGLKSNQIEKVLGYKVTPELIHRDNLVIL